MTAFENALFLHSRFTLSVFSPFELRNESRYQRPAAESKGSTVVGDCFVSLCDATRVCREATEAVKAHPRNSHEQSLARVLTTQGCAIRRGFITQLNTLLMRLPLYDAIMQQICPCRSDLDLKANCVIFCIVFPITLAIHELAKHRAPRTEGKSKASFFERNFSVSSAVAGLRTRNYQ